MAKIIINKDYFKNLSKGNHTIKVKFKDGYAEGTFKVDDKITFYINEELQAPFTATSGQTWADWIKSFDVGVSGNGIVWVGFDNTSIYIDPRCSDFEDYYYNYRNKLGDANLRLYDCDNFDYVNLADLIQPNQTYRCDICCFDAGTQILMADGTTKNIEDIVIGDKVVSYNEFTKSFEADEVTNTIIKHNSDDLVDIKLSNGTQLGMRAYHPLLTTTGWKSLRPAIAESLDDLHKEVPLLCEGDILVGLDQTPSIIKVINRNFIENYDTYNITIAKNHNYIANGIVAHNAGAPSCK